MTKLILALGLGLVAAVAFAAVPAAAADAAYIQVAPNPVAVGGTTTVYGHGFCSSGCSPVTVDVEQRQVASGVAVGADGSFQATFKVTEFPGQYHVFATQTAADSSVIRASFGLVVQQADRGPTPSPPPAAATPPATAPPLGSQPTPVASPESSPSPAIGGVDKATPSAGHSVPTGVSTPLAGTGARGPAIPWWWLLVIALAVLLAAAATLVMIRRRSRQG